jgi:hypothetical protein
MSAPESPVAQSPDVLEIQTLIDLIKQSVRDQANALAKACLNCGTPGVFQKSLCTLRADLEPIRNALRDYEHRIWRLLNSKDLPRSSVRELEGIVKANYVELDGLFWDLPRTPRVRP